MRREGCQGSLGVWKVEVCLTKKWRQDGDGQLDQAELTAALKHEAVRTGIDGMPPACHAGVSWGQEFIQMLYSFEVPVMDAESCFGCLAARFVGPRSGAAL